MAKIIQQGTFSFGEPFKTGEKTQKLAEFQKRLSGTYPPITDCVRVKLKLNNDVQDVEVALHAVIGLQSLQDAPEPQTRTEDIMGFFKEHIENVRNKLSVFFTGTTKVIAALPGNMVIYAGVVRLNEENKNISLYTFEDAENGNYHIY